MKYKAIVMYDGTKYNGFQTQKNQNTIQNNIEHAIFLLTGEKVKIRGAGRTDAGVHAVGQVCDFTLEKDFDVNRFPRAINHFLPQDISIREISVVESDFNSRADAKNKTYRYTIYQAKNRNPLKRLYAFNTSYGLNFDAMKEAAKYFEGEHDFKAFQNTGSNVKITIRTINYITLEKVGTEEIAITINGTGFLYNMVRIIAGTLFEVGIGKIKTSEVEQIIAGGDRNKAGKTLPANGLCLLEVNY